MFNIYYHKGMDLVKRWLPVLKKWKMRESLYLEAAQALETILEETKKNNEPLQLSKFLFESMPQVRKKYEQQSCVCQLKVILATGCQCGGI